MAIIAGITVEIRCDVRVDVVVPRPSAAQAVTGVGMISRRLPYFGALYHGLTLYAYSRCRWCRRRLSVDGRQWLVCAKCNTKYPTPDPTRVWPRLS